MIGRRVAFEGRRRVAGVSLIEVLVAMLVVSFGVLAMSGLLTNSARFGKTSEFRAVATLLANDIADRMRANMPGVTGGSYVLNTAFEWPPTEPTADNGCTQAVPCVGDNGAALAAKDLADWQRALYFGLPAGAGYISVSADFTAADVWVAWMDPAAVEETAMADDGLKECPDAFVNGLEPPPRCAYFRVGL
jgi:type IV pilus assembly protein PilV